MTSFHKDTYFSAKMFRTTPIYHAVGHNICTNYALRIRINYDIILGTGNQHKNVFLWEPLCLIS